MKKIALFGGSFNPIHKGHINLALAQNNIEQFEKIIIMPSNIPPHKSTIDFASNEHRMNMCKLSVLGQNIFEVSDIEYKMGGISYTFNTVSKIKSMYPDSQLFLIIGGDMLYSFDSWRCYKDILNKVTLLVGAREHGEHNLLLNFSKRFSCYGEIKVNKINVMDISSTAIRKILRDIATDDDITQYYDSLKGYLDKNVIKYIFNNRLYI